MSPNGPRIHYSFKRLERDDELKERMRELWQKNDLARRIGNYSYFELCGKLERASGDYLDTFAEDYGLQRRIVDDHA